MKRDWDLIRRILTAAEDKPPGEQFVHRELEDEDQNIVGAHIELLRDAGFINATVQQTLDGNYAIAYINSITASGYDLLDTFRSKSLWDKIKSTASEKGLSLSFDVIKAVGKLVLAQVLKSD